MLERSRAKLSEYEALWPRPSVDRAGTEESFQALTARFVRLVCEAQDLNPTQKQGFRIDEFEVWSAGPQPLNVALAVRGGMARGKARDIQDFPNAYGPQHAIDGQFGKRFFAASSDLTIELAEPTLIERVFFSSARIEGVPEHAAFVFVADYRIEVSLDGETWREVAHGRDRKPVPRKFDNPNKPTQRTYRSHLDHRLLQLGMTAGERSLEESIKKDLSRLRREIAAAPELPSAWMGKRSAEDAKGPFHVFIGGNPQRKGVPVVPASLSTLDRVMKGYRLTEDADEATRRLELANWIAHPDNPLTARVLANRLWQHHFGIGIVDTPNDFGYMGGRPSHPELLDFLATELKRNHWQLKAMHRLIATSRAYRQASAWRSDGALADSDSRLLWRFPPRRLSAEEIRDTILKVSGKLNTRMGGPGFRLYELMQDNVCTYVPLDTHGPETYRRAVYHQNARASVIDLMTDFDQPDCALSNPTRTETTTPLQALTLMNHSFTIDMAEAFAEEVRGQAGQDPEACVRETFRRAYQRAPDAEELSRATIALKNHGLRALCRAILNSSELIYID